MTSVLFVDTEGEQIASSQMSAVPRVGDDIEFSPVIGTDELFTVRQVVWQVFSDSPIANSAVVVLGKHKEPKG